MVRPSAMMAVGVALMIWLSASPIWAAKVWDPDTAIGGQLDEGAIEIACSSAEGDSTGTIGTAPVTEGPREEVPHGLTSSDEDTVAAYRNMLDTALRLLASKELPFAHLRDTVGLIGRLRPSRPDQIRVLRSQLLLRDPSYLSDTQPIATNGIRLLEDWMPGPTALARVGAPAVPVILATITDPAAKPDERQYASDALHLMVGEAA